MSGPPVSVAVCSTDREPKMNLKREIPPNPFDHLPPVPELRVASSDIQDGEPLAQPQLAGPGGNISPALMWDEGPEGTASYAVGCFDADAPTPGGLWHWLIVDIPQHVRELPTGAGTNGVAGIGRPLRSDLGTTEFTGAAPPPDDHAHRYIFPVYALRVHRLDIDGSTPASLAGFHLTVSCLARGLVTGLA